MVIGNYGNGKCTKVKYMVSDTYLLCELDFVCITNVLGESLMRWLSVIFNEYWLYQIVYVRWKHEYVLPNMETECDYSVMF